MNNTEITIKTEWFGNIGIVTTVDRDNKIHYYCLNQLALAVKVFTDNTVNSVRKLSDEEASKYEQWCLKTND